MAVQNFTKLISFEVASGETVISPNPALRILVGRIMADAKTFGVANQCELNALAEEIVMNLVQYGVEEVVFDVPSYLSRFLKPCCEEANIKYYDLYTNNRGVHSLV